MSRCPNCEKAARADNAARREAGEVGGTVVDRNGRQVAFSEEERKRRSELAKRLHAEGRFGGAVAGRRGGQAVQRHRIADAVLDFFRQPDEQKLVIDAFRSGLKGKNKALRVKTANDILRAEVQQDERLRADRGGAFDPAGMTMDELQEFVAQGLATMIERGELPEGVGMGDVEVTAETVA